MRTSRRACPPAAIRPASRGRQVPVRRGQLAVGRRVRRLAHEQVRALGQPPGGVAHGGVHDEREPLPGAHPAHVRDVDPPPVGDQPPLPQQPADVRARHAPLGEQLGHHRPAVGLDQPVADRRQPVLERGGLQRQVSPRQDGSVVRDGVRHHLEPVGVRRRAAQAGDVLPRAARVDQGDGAVDAVQGHALQHAGQAQAVVAVGVGDADSGDRRGRYAGQDHLALRALARVEQDALGVPAQQVAVVVARAGRDLGRGPEHHQLAR